MNSAVGVCLERKTHQRRNLVASDVILALELVDDVGLVHLRQQARFVSQRLPVQAVRAGIHTRRTRSGQRPRLPPTHVFAGQYITAIRWSIVVNNYGDRADSARRLDEIVPEAPAVLMQSQFRLSPGDAIFTFGVPHSRVIPGAADRLCRIPHSPTPVFVKHRGHTGSRRIRVSGLAPWDDRVV